jgi:two-component system chemotaxis sensor kinase CheA
MVIFEVRPGERMAMPLSAVERIESVPVGELEFAGGRAVLQYRGEVLTLEDEGEVLRELGVAWGDGAARTPLPAPGQWITGRWATDFEAAGDGAAAMVLICLRPSGSETRRAGVVVRRVLDITAGAVLPEDTAEFAGRLALVRGRLTTVHRECVGGVDGMAAALQEVA